MKTNVDSNNFTALPTIYILSDSVGITAQAVARAAAVQFGVSDPTLEVISKVESFDDIQAFLKERRSHYTSETKNPPLLVFYTLVNRGLAREFASYAAACDDLVAVDILTAAIEAIETVTGIQASSVAGKQHVADQSYFKRIEAEEFTIDHDDGRNPQDLIQADIVLLGVSRTSKTPLAIYLSQQGYKVANVPLDLQSDPPPQLFEVERTRLFGLMTTPEVLFDIRRRRLSSASSILSKNYADLEYIYQELEDARALMRRLGCIVIHTEHRAVEETAQEIIHYYEHAHPVAKDTDGWA